eukprot:CAMPEP_0201869558 /NCGR_PEP_ID=MMETSP0902-20130614/3031_1 /ASSEMBLY_ACC=CAM_ASM_000551 /TAXON_ID=420261 /ORGANISM="Thalassiosira antarctica, Strain CCMP982" /LENGTH=1165 /DNA_ID=CAMNT_0048395085 /DNA_START=172 /DNA_END=3669 /DNA_ORIENTATION=+
MNPEDDADDHYIDGCHGTLAPQQDEAFYDDRSDASDDMEKGRLKFPTSMYGRDRELELLRSIYDELVAAATTHDAGKGIHFVKSTAEEKEDKTSSTSTEPFKGCDPFRDSRILFMSGYSGVGKSALVNEFIKQTQSKYQSSSDGSQSVIHTSGKFTEQSTSSAPFSAITEVLEKLVIVLNDNVKENALYNADLQSKVWTTIRESELIGPGKEGNQILRTTFPILAPLLDSCDKTSPPQGSEEKVSNSTVHPSMNAINESTHELLEAITASLDQPLIIFLDDLQWGDGSSIQMMSFLLTSAKLRNIMFICAYRSNKVDAGHSFAKLMNNVKEARQSTEPSSSQKSVEGMDLLSLSREAITMFIADSVKKDVADDVAELAEAVYTKTTGNIFFVKQALEELVRKNILFYDVMYFEWSWVVSKLELGNYMSDDVVETVKGKIKDLPGDVQRLLVVMAYLPNTLTVPILKALMNHGELSFDEAYIRDLLKKALEEGMLLISVERRNYVFAHDMIRQASFGQEGDENQEELLLHISQVLLDVDQEPKMEWCLYAAVDLRNSLPADKINHSDLAKLNLRVAQIARSRGCMRKENELLKEGQRCLVASGFMWEDYALTLELYNAVIVSDYSVGSLEHARIAIGEVLKHTKSLDDKLQAHRYQLLCQTIETRDYSMGVEMGITILNLYGFNIPAKLKKTYMMKEQMKLKMAMKNRSYSCLVDLPLTYAPVLSIFYHVIRCALFSENKEVLKLLTWKAIKYSLKNGIDKDFPRVISMLGASLAKRGKVKAANELGNVSLQLTDNFREEKEICAITKMTTFVCILNQVQPFCNSLDPLLQFYKDLKFCGNVEISLGSMLAYFHSYVAAGLELSPLLESKLTLTELYCQQVHNPSFHTSFKMCRQFSLNLKTRTNNPTKLLGEAFNEDEELIKMNDHAREMALRDSSSLRLQLAFIFWDEDTMVDLLTILMDYPLTDQMIARLHNRLCFTGLAVFALGKRKGCESFQKLGQNCLDYFANLTKHGSVNAKPVYLFMLALKKPSRISFEKAIHACAGASMINLEAMPKERYAAGSRTSLFEECTDVCAGASMINLEAIAKERYATYLREENDTTMANEYITSAYWLYQDWGAFGKVVELTQKFDFLKNSTTNTAKSLRRPKSSKRVSLSKKKYTIMAE